eukprot:3908999-Rhodomonas_salina.1
MRKTTKKQVKESGGRERGPGRGGASGRESRGSRRCGPSPQDRAWASPTRGRTASRGGGPEGEEMERRKRVGERGVGKVRRKE